VFESGVLGADGDQRKRRPPQGRKTTHPSRELRL